MGSSRKFSLVLPIAALLSAGALPIVAHAQDKPEACAAMPDAGERLLCYDGIFREKVSPSTSTGKWKLTTAKSQIDDTETNTLTLESEESIPGRFGGREHATLIIRCQENVTAAYFIMGGHFLADIEGHDKVTYRVDDQRAVTEAFATSTDNMALGKWSGGSAIPFIKKLGGGRQLVIRVTPYNESPKTATFNISGIDDALQPVRKGCNW